MATASSRILGTLGYPVEDTVRVLADIFDDGVDFAKKSGTVKKVEVITGATVTKTIIDGESVVTDVTFQKETITFFGP